MMHTVSCLYDAVNSHGSLKLRMDAVSKIIKESWVGYRFKFGSSKVQSTISS